MEIVILLLLGVLFKLDFNLISFLPSQSHLSFQIQLEFKRTEVRKNMESAFSCLFLFLFLGLGERIKEVDECIFIFLM